MRRSALHTVARSVLPAFLIDWLGSQSQMRRLHEQPKGQAVWDRLATKDLYQPEFWWRRADVLESWAADIQTIHQLFSTANAPCGPYIGDLQALYMLIRSLQPARLLEIGTHAGLATLTMALAMGRNGHGQMVSVDLLDANHPIGGMWRSYGLKASPREMLALSGLENYVQFVAQNPDTFLMHDETTYDLVLVNGDTDADAVYRALVLASDRLSPSGGFILLHNVFATGKRQYGKQDAVVWGPVLAAARLESEYRELKLQPLSPLPWMTRAGTHHSSLALLFRR